MEIGDNVFIIHRIKGEEYIFLDRPKKITKKEYRDVYPFKKVECYHLDNSECVFYPWELILNVNAITIAKNRYWVT